MKTIILALALIASLAAVSDAQTRSRQVICSQVCGADGSCIVICN